MASPMSSLSNVRISTGLKSSEAHYTYGNLQSRILFCTLMHSNFQKFLFREILS
jgi:hypothetical protein